MSTQDSRSSYLPHSETPITFWQHLSVFWSAGSRSDQISVLGDHESITDRFQGGITRTNWRNRAGIRPGIPESRTTIDHVIDAISELWP